jgi:hypothetical protein
MGIKKLATLGATAAILGTFVFATAAQASPDTSRIYRIMTANGLALDVQGASTADDAPVIQWGVNGGLNQEWKFVPSFGTDRYQIVNVNSGKCLSVYYNSGSAGANLVQYTCHDWLDQRWAFHADVFGLVSFQSTSSGLYASVPADTPQWGKQLIQWPDSGSWDLSESFYLTQLA